MHDLTDLTNADEKCTVTLFHLRTKPSGDIESFDKREVGVMTWGELADYVRTASGTRLSYDLFEVPFAKGIVRRYRAVDIKDAERAVTR